LESHQWEKLDIPASRATNEWKKFQNLRDAKNAIALSLKKNSQALDKNMSFIKND
jgi:hypothetical protein